METIYSTKFALTAGILKHDAEINGSIAQYRPNADWYKTILHGEGDEWHRTMESAIARAEVLRERKIAALKKKISKLEAMTFEVK